MKEVLIKHLNEYYIWPPLSYESLFKVTLTPLSSPHISVQYIIFKTRHSPLVNPVQYASKPGTVH